MVYSATTTKVTVTVTTHKWKKGRCHILNLIKLTGWDPKEHNFSLMQSFLKVPLSYKLLEQTRGFFMSSRNGVSGNIFLS